MDTQTIRRLCQLNNDFYQANHASFSNTRQHAWPGWLRLLDSIGERPASVLDVACGNLRFKSFLESRNMNPERYYAVDSCAALVPPSPEVVFQQLDITGAICEGKLAAHLSAPACHLTVCFGFMHHVPSFEYRALLLDELVAKTAAKGLLAISFWQFARDEGLHAKAIKTTQRGCAELGLTLEDNDFLLGWKDVEGAWRYCHSFNDAELDELARRCSDRAVLVDRFRADGRTDDMNQYLVLRAV